MRSHKKIQKEEQPSRTSLIQIGPGLRYIRSATRSLYTSETSLVALRKPAKEASQGSLHNPPQAQKGGKTPFSATGTTTTRSMNYLQYPYLLFSVVNNGSTDADTPAESHKRSAWNGGCWPFDSDSGSTQPVEQPILERWTKTAVCVCHGFPA